MVHITEDLIRRRAEHNDGEIFSLEEVSLHQQDIERIEHIDRWCRHLRILYLQNNLIPKIENLGHLKKLEYLNLALNSIEVIENLEGLESLQKLDLTVNFVGLLSSVESLKHNIHLRELFLVGNPCTQFEGYRRFVVAALPQIKWLDGTEISRSERIGAAQGLEEVRRRVGEQEREYLRRRAQEKEEEEEAQRKSVKEEKQKKAASQENKDQELKEDQENPELDEEREFWHTPCSFTPESRLQAYRYLEERRKVKQEDEEKKPKTQRTLITAEGRVMNVNEPKLGFSLTEDEDNNTVILDLAVYRHMDTSLMDVDVQPTFARVLIRGKVFQVVLPAEVKPDSSTAQRSQTTGHLVLTMPRAKGEIKVTGRQPGRTGQNKRSSWTENREIKAPERLEVDPSRSVHIFNIVPQRSGAEGPPQTSRTGPGPPAASGQLSEGFVDDPEVPPLI